jgi:hypothetical protein
MIEDQEGLSELQEAGCRQVRAMGRLRLTVAMLLEQR